MTYTSWYGDRELISMMFNEHGESSFRVDGNIVTFVMKGAFNEYGFRTAANRIKSIVDSFHGEKFYILMNATEAVGGTPELYQEMNKYNEWLNTQNIVAKAIVILSKINLDIYSARVTTNKTQNQKSFDNESDALKWLKNQVIINKDRSRDLVV